MDEAISRRAFLGAAAGAALVGLAACDRTGAAESAEAEDEPEPAPSSKEHEATEVAAAEGRDLGTSDFEVSSVDVKALATEDVDVVVVGAGMAGFACALSLAEANADAKIVLVDKGVDLGDGTAFATRIAGPYPLAHEPAVAADRAAKLATWTHGVGNPLLLRALFADMEENCAWLFDEHGVPWESPSLAAARAAAEEAQTGGEAAATAAGEPADDAPAQDADGAAQAGETDGAAAAVDEAAGGASAGAAAGDGAGSTAPARGDWALPEAAPVLFDGAAAIRTFNADAVDFANLHIVSERPATQLLLRSEYEVTGVRTREGTDYIDFQAKAVVLACGGMSSNKTLLANYSNVDMEKLLVWSENQDGDGHLMAEQTAHGRCEHVTVAAFANTVDGFPRDSALGCAVGMQPQACWVNESGVRFCSEDATRASEVVQTALAQGSAWSLLDAEAVARIAREGLTRGFGDFSDDLVGVPIENLQAQVDDALESLPDVCVSADTVEGLATAIGVSAEALAAQLAAYNAGDDPWGKDAALCWPVATPPFYAFRLSGSMMATQGGVRINGNCQVCDARGKTVKGLYAAGACTSGWMGEVAPNPIGAAIALWTGRRAAAHIAEKLL